MHLRRRGPGKKINGTIIRAMGRKTSCIGFTEHPAQVMIIQRNPRQVGRLQIDGWDLPGQLGLLQAGKTAGGAPPTDDPSLPVYVGVVSCANFRTRRRPGWSRMWNWICSMWFRGKDRLHCLMGDGARPVTIQDSDWD